jgi:hypothetical protein
MAPSNIGQIVADAWDRVVTLSSYGYKPLTVGWWRGESFVKVWDYRTGDMAWKPFKTERAQGKPKGDPFAMDMYFR